MKKVHIVNHTHWDREWYFSTMDSLVLSDSIFNEILEELKKNPDAFFTLDGQISIVNEFLQLYPEKIEDIKNLTKRGQLLIGPWYTQSDAQLVHGESIIRNLAIGVRDTRKIAEPMLVGYLPDTFGFHAQMPTILINCGIDNFVFWRGIDYEKISSPYFIWKGLSNKKVYALNLMNGYGSIPRLYNDKEFLEYKVFSQENKVRSKTNLEEILIPIGNDQNKITNQISDKIHYINKITESEYCSSNYPQYFDYLRKNEKLLEVFEGEMRVPKVGRVHKTIGSIRMDIKLGNYELEQILLKRVEPLIVFAENLNISISKELAIIAWKKVMEGQAHDGLAGCINDSVANDVLYRFKQAKEICEGVENLIKKRISDALQLTENQLLVFHLEPNQFNGYKHFTVLSKNPNVKIKGCEQCVTLSCTKIDGRDDVLVEGKNENYFITEDPYYEIEIKAKLSLMPFSYQVFELETCEEHLVKKNKELSIRNEKYHVFVDNQSLSIHFEDETIRDFIRFEDCGNDGDTYDYSPLRNDKEIIFSVLDGYCIKNDIQQNLHLKTKILLPKTLKDRYTLENQSEMEVELFITLLNGEEHPTIKVVVHNNVESHRLRMLVKTNRYAKEARASIPFGYLTRKVGYQKHSWQDQYLECPIDIEVMENSISLLDDKGSCSVFSKGVKEYQIINDMVCLTLFSSTGQLGKSDLLYRPGRASGDTTKQGHVMIPTPLAQVMKTMCFEFMVAFHSDFSEERCNRLYSKFVQQNIYYQAQTFNKFIHRIDNKIQSVDSNLKLDKQYSMFQLEGYDVTSIMPSLYTKKAFVVRIQNATFFPQKIDIADLRKKFEVVFVDGLENEVKDITEIDAYDFIQLKIK